MVCQKRWHKKNPRNTNHQRENIKARKDTSTQNKKSQEPSGKRLLLPTTQKTEKETPARSC